jgi:O-antigen ligase
VENRYAPVAVLFGPRGWFPRRLGDLLGVGGEGTRSLADVSLTVLLGLALLVRVLTDDRASPDSHRSGSVNLSGAIAIVLIALAAALQLRRRRGVGASAAAMAFLVLWTALAIHTRGASAETLREGVREASIVAVAVIVVNARTVLRVPVVARLIQLAGLISAVLALYQMATNTGVDLLGQIRSNGTFAHPDGASMYFAIAATLSAWLYLDAGHGVLDAILTAVFLCATISTYSLAGVVALLTMLAVLAAARQGTRASTIGLIALIVATVVVFLATPLGARRVSQESASHITLSPTSTTPNSSLSWRLYKWRTLFDEWKKAPILGSGIGTTVTAEGTAAEPIAGREPHNEYLRYLVETGVVGLAILLSALASLLIRLIRMRRGFDSGNEAALALAVVSGCAVNALGDNTFLYTTTGYAFALVVAAAVASLPKKSPALAAA